MPNPPIVDADVHTMLASDAILARYLPAQWRAYVETYGLRHPDSIGFFATRPRHFACRDDAWPPGGVPGGDLPFMQEQLLDRYGISAAILNPINVTTCAAQHAELSAALSRALNEWTQDKWLDKDARLFAAICIPADDAALAAAEIHRLAGNPRFLHVLLPVRTARPVGSRAFWPLFEAAVAHDLPVALHVGGHSGNTITGAGWPSYYFEDHSGYPQAFQAQVVSLVCEGVFERFPTLKIILQEGGFAWLAPLMWRLDAQWERLRDEVPHITRRPSETIREHVWFTTQPIEEPERAKDFPRILEHLDMDGHALFASDYPHWDFDDPETAFPRELGAKRRARWLAGNALDLYPSLPR